MDKNEFLSVIQKEITDYNSVVATDKGDWIVKGFIDIYKQIYTITVDTKVVSKVLEILLIPAFKRFADKYDLEFELPKEQNSYPDLSFTSRKSRQRFAVDIKSTFKDSGDKIKPMTLGAFTGYFRNRESNKNTLYPYGEYAAHFVLGVIYTQNKSKVNETSIYSLDDLHKIESVIRDFRFFCQPKYKIASASPGSGNTKNIGSTVKIDQLVNGTGIFAELGGGL